MVRTVRLMAIETIFPDRRMLPNEGTAFFVVALVTQLIDGNILEQWRGIGTVRIMTIDTGHLAFRQRHMRTFIKLYLLLLVAGETGLIDILFAQQALLRQFRHWIVAIAARQIVDGMDGTRPIQALGILMAL